MFGQTGLGHWQNYQPCSSCKIEWSTADFPPWPAVLKYFFSVRNNDLFVTSSFFLGGGDTVHILLVPLHMYLDQIRPADNLASGWGHVLFLAREAKFQVLPLVGEGRFLMYHQTSQPKGTYLSGHNLWDSQCMHGVDRNNVR